MAKRLVREIKDNSMEEAAREQPRKWAGTLAGRDVGLDLSGQRWGNGFCGKKLQLRSGKGVERVAAEGSGHRVQ